jgi:GT2 family glycosyltransferase
MSDVVVAVVVTFNRKKYLLECLEALKKQTYSLAEIVIVDNASTDGTSEFVQKSGILNDPTCRYVRLNKNTGGAGGFNAGMALALETKASWLWVMDDDVAPEPNCLEQLLNYKKISECIHPRKTLLNGDDYVWEHHIDILTGGRTIFGNKSFENGKDIVFTNVACFEGMLVSRRIVEVIGLPDPKYFIAEDDTLFGIKASVHTNVAYVAGALMHKLIPLGIVSPWKSYYMMRNRFYLHRDSCDYMGLSPSLSVRILFLLSQVFELIRLIRRGSAFIKPATRGFVDGFQYMRKG